MILVSQACWLIYHFRSNLDALENQSGIYVNFQLRNTHDQIIRSLTTEQLRFELHAVDSCPRACLSSRLGQYLSTGTIPTAVVLVISQLDAGSIVIHRNIDSRRACVFGSVGAATLWVTDLSHELVSRRLPTKDSWNVAPPSCTGLPQVALLSFNTSVR